MAIWNRCVISCRPAAGSGRGLCMYLVIFLHLPDLLTVIIQVVVGLGIYLTGSAILELDTFEYFKDVLAPSIRQKLKR